MKAVIKVCVLVLVAMFVLNVPSFSDSRIEPTPSVPVSGAQPSLYDTIRVYTIKFVEGTSQLTGKTANEWFCLIDDSYQVIESRKTNFEAIATFQVPFGVHVKGTTTGKLTPLKKVGGCWPLSPDEVDKVDEVITVDVGWNQELRNLTQIGAETEEKFKSSTTTTTIPLITIKKFDVRRFR